MQTATTESRQVRTIPAALFDELKKRADAKGGIGYFWRAEGNPEFPSCILDFAADIDGKPSIAKANADLDPTPSLAALGKALGEFAGTQSDQAVAAINERKGVRATILLALPRVSFDELAAELGLVRGEA